MDKKTKLREAAEKELKQGNTTRERREILCTVLSIALSVLREPLVCSGTSTTKNLYLREQKRY